MVHSCPRCELRFVTAAELAEHLRVDHDVDIEGLERFHYKAPDQPPPTERNLGVRNQTRRDEP
jgi:hypothetical protein